MTTYNFTIKIFRAEPSTLLSTPSFILQPTPHRLLLLLSLEGTFPSRRGEGGEAWSGGPLWSPA